MRTITVWQTCVQGEWRYADPETAALVTVAGNPVRLAELSARPFLKITRGARIGIRGATQGRLLAAKRAIEKQIQNAGLFSEMAKASAESPEQRIANIDEWHAEMRQGLRDIEARQWREVRKTLAKLPERDRAYVVYRFNNFLGPHIASTLMYLIKRHTEKTSALAGRAA
jgi:hypothetical protein